MRALVCAATKSERDAVARGIRSAAVSGYELLLTGVGPAHAASALRRRLSRRARPDLVISTGFAGALTPGVERMAWVTASRIFEWDGANRIPIADLTLREAPKEAIRCELVSSAKLVVGLSAVAHARGEAPLVVDMESAALARQAVEYGLAFTVLRLVSDTLEQPLPSFVSAFADAMSANRIASRVALTARGVQAALRDPRGVVGMVRNGRDWTHGLAEGWKRFASGYLSHQAAEE